MRTVRVAVTVTLGALSVAVCAIPAQADEGTRVTTASEPGQTSPEWWGYHRDRELAPDDRELGTDGTRVTADDGGLAPDDRELGTDDRELGTDGTRVTGG
ncbi:hypothetical protein [Spirillospora sp. CA-294931]|uniref:hypothetical protein n=1 Tax=Spirillospora sp. CA-294931 TaxID=3240042 RepID=UPI003D942E65